MQTKPFIVDLLIASRKFYFAYNRWIQFLIKNNDYGTLFHFISVSSSLFEVMHMHFK